jgi:hypothetical protein
VHAHFTYRSQTQRTIHTTPFLWLICATGWLLTFEWLFQVNGLLNALVRLRAGRLGPIDLSTLIEIERDPLTAPLCRMISRPSRSGARS